MSIFKEPFKTEIKTQIQDVREPVMNASIRSPQELTWLNSRNAWIRMTSAVEVNGDGGDLARQYVLQGGTLNTTITSGIVTSSLKPGVGSNFNNAYSNQNTRGNYRLGLRPMPGITNIEVKSRGAYGSLREVTVNFNCWDIRQLEDLELLYMRPGYTVMIEWGWSPYLDNNSVLQTSVDFIDDVLLGTGPKENIWKKIFQKNRDTGGNYDAVYGYIKNYSWKARPDGGYDCTTTVITIGEILESLKVNYTPANSPIVVEGWFPDETRPIGVAVPFAASSSLAEAYQKNIIAGLATELKLIFEKNPVLAPSLFPVSTRLTLLDRNGKRKSIVGGKFRVSITGQPENIKKSAFDDAAQYYILLADFIEILNDYVLLQDTDNNVPFAGVSVREGNHMEHPARPLLCIGNRYQISVNPLICLIANLNYYDPTTLGFTKSCPTIQNVVAGFTNGTYVGMLDPSEVPPLFQKEYFYKSRTSVNSSEYGVIGNIYVNLAHIYSLSLSGDLENADNKEKKEINLYDFLKTLMKNINGSIGNVADFDLFVDPTDSIIRIIDVNYVNPTPANDVWNNATTINLHNTLSTARNYTFESKIYPEQSTTVAIGAQVQGGALGKTVQTLVDFNQNLKDRIIPKKDDPSSQNIPTSSRETNIKNSINILSEYFCNLSPDWWDAAGDFNVNEASRYENALRDIINYVMDDPNLGGLNNNAIIPTKLSIEMDGLSGMIIGNIFRINEDIVPRGYKGGDGIGRRVGYLVTGLNHSVGKGDWVTKIDSQFFIVEDPKPVKNIPLPSPPPSSTYYPPVPIVGISVGASISVASIKVNYTLSINNPLQTDTKINFTHILTLKDGTQIPINETGTISAGKTSTVVVVDISEYKGKKVNANDLAYATDEYNETIANISSNYDVIYSNTIYTNFPQDANKQNPIPFATNSVIEKPKCPGAEELTIEKIIKALQNKGYPFYSNTESGRGYLNVVGIRNADKDFGDIDPTTGQTTNGVTNQDYLKTQKGYIPGKKGKPVVNKFTDWLTFFYWKNIKHDPNEKNSDGTFKWGIPFIINADKKSYGNDFTKKNGGSLDDLTPNITDINKKRFTYIPERIELIGKATTLPGKTFQSKKFFSADYNSSISSKVALGGKDVSLGRNVTLLEGHYKDFYILGKHRSIEDTLKLSVSYKQDKPIYRIDKGLDSIYTFNGFFEGDFWNGKTFESAKQTNPYITGLVASNGRQFATNPATNIHPSGVESGPTKPVDNWSAGCQVWREFSEWKKMSDAALEQIAQRGKKTYNYTLLHIRDIPGFENCFEEVV